MGHPKDNERGTTPRHRGLTPPKRSIIPKWNSGFYEPLAPRSKHPILHQEIEEKAAKEEAFDQTFISLDQTRGKGDRSHHRRALVLLANSIVKGASSTSDLGHHLKLHIQSDTSPRLFNEKDAELLIRTTFENFIKVHKIEDRDFVWVGTFELMEEYKKKVANYRQEIITEIENDDLLLVRMDWNKRVQTLARESNIDFPFANLLLSYYLAEKNRSEGLRLPKVDPKLYHAVQGAVSGQRLLFSTSIVVTNPFLSIMAILAIFEADGLVGAITGKSVLFGDKLKAWERVLNIALFVIPLCKPVRLLKYSAGAGIQIGKTLLKKVDESAKFIAVLAYKSGVDLATVIKNAKRLGGMSEQMAHRLWRTTRASITNKKPLKITQLERAFVKELDEGVRLFKGKKPSLKTPHKATKKHSQRSQDDISMERAFSEDANFDHGSFLSKGRMKRPKSDEPVPPFDLLPLTIAQKAGVKRISGKRLSTGFQGAWQRIIDNNPRAQREILETQRLFNSGQVEAAKKLGRDAYNRARGRFWRYIRGAKDEQALALKSQLDAAGLRFSGSNGTAPYWQFPDGYKEILTLEHANRVTDAPWRAVAADNFQFVPFRENVNTLEWIRGLAEFQ